MLTKLAWRNIGRNRRRTVITITAVAFATLLSIGMRGLQLGTYKENIENAVSLFTGYMQVQKPGYIKNPSLRKSFPFDKQLRTAIESNRYIKGYAPRVYAEGLAAKGDVSLGALIFGISPRMEKGVTTLHNRLAKGKFLVGDSSSDIVVGAKLLKNLDARIGDTVVVLAQGYDGTLGNMLFRIVGTVKTGMGELDRSAIFMGLKTAQKLLSMEGRISTVALSLPGLKHSNAAKKELAARLEPMGLVCKGWDEILPELKQSIEFDNAGGILTLAILIVVVAFGILDTVLMSVTERFREFGVILAMGMPNSKLARLVILESIFITVLGIVIGNIGAVAVNHYFTIHPIVASGQTGALYEEYGFLPLLRSTLEAGIFIRVSIVIFAISMLSIVYPVIKVLHLEPLKGIRYT